MASLIESYEQQYSTLTADITLNINRIASTHGDRPVSALYCWPSSVSWRTISSENRLCEIHVANSAVSLKAAYKNILVDTLSAMLPEAEKQKYVRQLEKLFEEATELLEQMDLEAKDLPLKEKQKYQTRVKSYKTELNKLQQDTRRAKLGIDSARDELLGDDTRDSEDQRKRLLDNTESIERSSRRLEHGYRIAMETEQIGAQVLEDLNSQRHTIQRSRNRLEEMNTNLGKSSRVLSGMMRRIIQNRLVLFIISVILIFVISLAIYLIVHKKS